MTKAKILMIIVLVISSVLVLPNMAMATTETVTAEKIVTSTNGSVEYIIKGLNLDEGSSYQWAIEKTKEADRTNWYDVTAPEYSAGSIRITISAGNKELLTILKSTDIAYVTVRKAGETSNILENYKVDLSLPVLKVFNVYKSAWYHSTNTNPAYEINTIYGMKASNVSFKWEKITDANIINSYIDNNHDLSGLNLKGIESFPSLSDTSWKSVHQKYDNMELETGIINNNEEPTEYGLYYLWLKGSAEDVKTIYGQAVLEVGEVEKINENVSNNNGGSDNKQEETKQQTSESSNNQNYQTTGSNDQTTAKGELPKAGVSVGIVTTLILVLGVAILVYFRYNKLKDIK